MSLDYDLEMAAGSSRMQVAVELIAVSKGLGLLEGAVAPVQLVEDGAVTNLRTWVKVYDATPQSWAPVVTDFGVTPTVGIGFQLYKDGKLSEQGNDMVRIVSGMLDRIGGDALFSGLDTIWLVRKDGDLRVNERDDIWTPERLALLNQPYRRERLAFAED